MIRVVTCCWGVAPETYGRQFVESFAKFWPKSHELVVYADRPMPLPRGEWRDLMEIDGLAAFQARHADNPTAHGKQKAEGWRVRDLQSGYSFRHDAAKWAYQAMTPSAAADGLVEDDILVWLDADTVTTSPVPEKWIETLLDDKDVAYLGREGSHSEIGFMAFRMLPGRQIVDRFADIYRTDEVFKLTETHSAFVFDVARVEAGLPEHNLNPGGKGHVWPTSALAEYTKHLKGNRKFTTQVRHA